MAIMIEEILGHIGFLDNPPKISGPSLYFLIEDHKIHFLAKLKCQGTANNMVGNGFACLTMLKVWPTQL